eukprot:CAMPEP_0117423198 /NCGR_PEP_ID=MMETSP0758-20121206/3871_1 /TAXON_ID=63605 /ORGANISM="Percolomonas cosmopolitus, Strain AE-1 (ATCC 50343)" /LENGTH=435 /DNA_ID=CAMNT_0005206245 /DNA_START=106 /DNA_END=1414 /DNA_ORIENTATION=-
MVIFQRCESNDDLNMVTEFECYDKNIHDGAIHRFYDGPVLVVNNINISLVFLNAEEVCRLELQDISAADVDDIEIISEGKEWNYLFHENPDKRPFSIQERGDDEQEKRRNQEEEEEVKDDMYVFYKYTMKHGDNRVFMLRFNPEYYYISKDERNLEFYEVEKLPNHFPFSKEELLKATFIKIIYDDFIVIGSEDKTLKIYDLNNYTSQKINLPCVPTSIHFAQFSSHSLLDHFIFIHYRKSKICTQHNIQSLDVEYEKLENIQGIITVELSHQLGIQVVCYAINGGKLNCTIFLSDREKIVSGNKQEEDIGEPKMKNLLFASMKRCEQLEYENIKVNRQIAQYSFLKNQASESLNYLMDSSDYSDFESRRNLRIIKTKSKGEDDDEYKNNKMVDDDHVQSIVDIFNPEQPEIETFSSISVFDHQIITTESPFLST